MEDTYNNVYGVVFQYGAGGGGGEECDYPDESDVRAGVMYDNGEKVGTWTGHDGEPGDEGWLG